jgi:hypothetical protein
MSHLANVKDRSFFFFSFLGRHHSRELAPESETPNLADKEYSVPQSLNAEHKNQRYQDTGFCEGASGQTLLK